MEHEWIDIDGDMYCVTRRQACKTCRLKVNALRDGGRPLWATMVLDIYPDCGSYIIKEVMES
jgi:hypothetical protein